MKRRLFFIPLLFFLLLLGGLAWVLLTEAGLQNTARLLVNLSGNRLQLEQMSGRFWDHLRIGRLHWQDVGTEVEVEGIALHWSPAALLHGTLEIHALGLGDVSLHTQSSDSPAHLPDKLALPVDVRIAALEAHKITFNDTLLTDSLGAVFESRAGMYELKALEARRGQLQLVSSATLAAQAPFALKLDATLSGLMADKPYALALHGQGDLKRNEWSLQQSQGPFTLAADAAIQPFSKQLIERFSVRADKLDIAALLPDLPHTLLDVRCNLADTRSGGCRIENKLAGPLDQNRIPVKEITAQLRRDEQTLAIKAINIAIGRGTLTGDATVNAAGADLKLNAQNLDLADIHGSLRNTQLAGPILLRSKEQKKTLQLELKDNSLAASAELFLHNDELTLQTLELVAQAALLKANGKLNTRSREFSLSGSLDRFDPSRFLRTAAGSINGNFKSTGRLDKTPRLTLDFGLHDSRFADAPVTGKGSIDLAWPHLKHADVALVLGKNNIRLLGAIGKPGEVLKLDVDAPALKPYGLEGDLQAQLEAKGSLAAPLLNGHMRSNSLYLPGYVRLQKLSLATNVGTAPDAPFELQLQLDRLDLSDRRNVVRKFDLDLQGTRREHRLRLSGYIADQKEFTAALHGSFKGKNADDWQGTLTQLTLENPEQHHTLKLVSEAPLAFASDRWSLGPLNIRTQRADFSLNAAAVPGKLTAHLSATNPQIGHVLFDLSARPSDVWHLSGQMPWQGRLQADISDLGWVNPMLDKGWQAGGKLKTDLQLAGTPQYPLINGKIDADELLLQNVGLGLHLRNGVLHAGIRDSVLHLNQFDMESVLTAPPPALRRLVGDRERFDNLTAKSGRLSATGLMKIGTLGMSSSDSEQLHLDITLDRFGVSQLPKQWLLLSGQSQLRWQGGKLGVTAKLEVDAAHWQLAELSRPQLSSDVVILGSDEENKTSVTPWNGEIEVSLGRYFSFEGAGASGRLAGRVQITASATDLPRASGSVNLVNGHYAAYGQQLDIERGILNFQGLLENPALNILAMRRGMQVDAGVEITGYAQSPKIRLVSEPYVPDTEKLSWLVLGRAPDQEGSDAGVLLAAVGAIFGNDMNNAGQHVKQSFGIDEFSVHSGTLGQTQNMNSRVAPLSNNQSSGQVLSVGRQLTQRLKVSYEQALGTTGNLVKLTFKLSNRVSVVGTSGSDAALDVFYSFAFGGKPSHKKAGP